MKKRFVLIILFLLLLFPIVSAEEFGVNFLDRLRTFLSLEDTPSTYSGSADKCVTVNSAGNGLEFITCPGGGGGGNFTPQDFQSAFDDNISNIAVGNFSFTDFQSAFNLNISEIDIGNFSFTDFQAAFNDNISNIDVGNFSFTDFQAAFNSNQTNIFNQSLNTSDSPSFQNITVEGNVTSGFFNGLFNWTINLPSQIYLLFNGNELTFNESQLNSTIEDIGDGKYLNLSGTNANQPINIAPFNFTARNIQINNQLTFESGEHSIEVLDSSTVNPTFRIDSPTSKTFWFQSSNLTTSSDVTFLFTVTNRTLIYAQGGANESAGGLGNSWMIIPNDFVVNNFRNADDTINISKITNCFNVINAFNFTSRIDCDSQGTGADFFVQDDIQTGGRLFSGDGIRSEGAVSFFLRGFDFDVFNGSSHFRTPRRELVGFEIGENATIFSKPFNDGTLSPFINTTSDPITTREWIVVADINCFNDQCARSQGGALSPIRGMQTNISTFGFKDLILNFSVTTIGISGTDLLNVTLNNNSGSGDFQIYVNTTPSSNALISIPLTSNYENISSITLSYNFNANVVTREAYINEVTIVGEATESSTLNITRLDTDIKLGDGTQRIFWNDTSKVLELPGNTSLINVQEENVTITDSLTLNGTTIKDFGQINANRTNLFDQVLNKSSNVQFANITSTGNVTIGEGILAGFYLTLDNLFRFNFYDDGSDLFMNVSNGGGDFSIEQENTKITLFNSPVAANTWKVFQVFSKEAGDQVEFVIAKRIPTLGDFTDGSFQIGGTSTNCTTLSNLTDCDTATTGADLLVEDDIWNGGEVFANNGAVNISSGSINVSNTVFINGSIDIQSLTGGNGGGGVDLMINETDGSEDYLNITNFNLSFSEEQLNSTIDDKITNAQAGACASSNAVISGGQVAWSLDDLIFHVSPTVYCIGGLQYQTNVTIDVTLDASNETFPRSDIIVVNISSTAGFVKGVPATDPLTPTADGSIELKLESVFLQAGATEPGNETGGGIAVELIYDEQNGADWPGVDNTGGKINFTASSNPSNGTVHIETETPISKNEEFRLNDPATFDPSSFTSPLLTIEIKVEVAWDNKDKLNVMFLDTGGNQLGTAIDITNGAFGFDAGNTAGYQILIIPLSDFGVLGSSVKSLSFTAQPFKQNTLDFLIDFIRITGTAGGGTPPVSGLSHSELDDLQTTSQQRANDDHDPRYLAKIVTSLQNIEGRLILNNSAFTPLTIEDGFGGITLNVSSDLFVDNANNRVGIGTDTPTQLLHLDGSGDVRLRVSSLASGGDARLSLVANETDGNSIINFASAVDGNIGRIHYDHSDDSLLFRVNDAEVARFISSGFFGLGTNAPTDTLNVIGTANISSGFYVDSAGDVGVGLGASSPFFQFNVVEDVVGARVSAFIQNTDNTSVNSHAEVFITNGGELGGDPLVRFIENGADEIWSVGIDNSDSDSFKISNAGIPSTNEFVIDTSGNVGIGTSTPQFPLHINTALNQVASFNSSDDSAIITIKDDNTQGFISATDSIFSLGGLAGDQATNLNINTSTGFVGIGTTIMDELLHVETTTDDSYIKMQIDSANGRGGYKIQNDAITWSMIVESNDNWRLLHGTTAVFLVSGSAPATALNLGSDEFVVNEAGSSAIDFRVESDTDLNALFLDSTNGNLGLGFDVPTEKLQVSGGAIVIDGKGVNLNQSGSAVLTISAESNTNTPSVIIGGVASQGFSAGGVLGLDRNSAGSWEALLHYLNANALQWRVGLDSDGTNDYVIQDASENDAINIVDKGSQFEVQIGGNLTTSGSLITLGDGAMNITFTSGVGGSITI